MENNTVSGWILMPRMGTVMKFLCKQGSCKKLDHLIAAVSPGIAMMAYNWLGLVAGEEKSSAPFLWSWFHNLNIKSI